MQEKEGVDNISKTIHSLSDEVLLEICGFLQSVDILSLSQTCTKFNSLLCERKIIRKVNLKAVYFLTLEKLKCFFQPQLRCKNVDTISLASCYWLTSSDILWAVQRLPNLTSLYVNDTQLSIKHLTHILKNLKMIQSLSWTFHMTKKIEICDIQALAVKLCKIKRFDLYIKDFGVFFLPILFQNCPVLEDLGLSSLKFRETPLDRTRLITDMSFELPSLKSLVLNLPEGPITGWIAFLPKLLSACSNVQFWRTLWLDTRVDIWTAGSQTTAFRDMCFDSATLIALSKHLSKTELTHALECKNLRYLVCDSLPPPLSLTLSNSNITHLVWNSAVLPESFPASLQHLCMECHETGTPVFAKSPVILDPLANLTKLSAPICVFLASNSTCAKPTYHEEPNFRIEFTRKSHVKELPTSDCILKQFLNVAANIQHLELKCDVECVHNKPSLGELANLNLIRHWTRLESLFLENIGVVEMSFLIEICSSCPNLRRLGLKHVGISGSFPRSRELAKAIMHLKNLQDFRFEHPTVEKLGDILEALTKQRNLQRVVIICKRTAAKQNISSFLSIVKKCSRLVFLFVHVSSITHCMSQEFQKELKSICINERKSLWARIEGNVEDSFWEICPAIHCNEMIKNPSLLRIKPP